MKKKFLYLIIPMFFATFSVSAQIRVWDFGGVAVDPFDGNTFTNMLTPADINSWYTGVTPGTTATNLPAAITISVGRLRWVGGNASDRLRTTDTSITRFDDSASAGTGSYSYLTGRLYVNTGASTTRGLYVTLLAGQQVTLIARSDAAGILHFSNDGATDLTAPTTTTLTEYHFTAGAPGEYHFYDAVSKPSYYRLYIGNVTTPTTLGINTFSEESDVTLYTKDNKVFFSNIKSKTDISIYSLTGALVKSAKVSEDLSLDVQNGIYIVKLKSDLGEKTTKVIVE